MSDIVERLRHPASVFYEYAADNGALLEQAADEIERLRAALQTAQRGALEEAALVIANKSVLETPAAFEDVLDRDLEMMATIRALGEKE